MSVSGEERLDRRVSTAGAPLHRARAAVVLVHGRGATADGMLSLAAELAQPEAAYLAPQADGRTWYPHSFLAPLDRNEPALSSALRLFDDVVRNIDDAGLSSDRIVLLGFSQGACLTLEFAARHARRYGGVAAFSGGLIGSGQRAGAEPPDDKLFEYAGSLAGTPVFLGCSDVDPHIPLQRVRETAEDLRSLAGDVTERIYPGMGHTINEDEIRHVRGFLARVVQARPHDAT